MTTPDYALRDAYYASLHHSQSVYITAVHKHLAERGWALDGFSIERVPPSVVTMTLHLGGCERNLTADAERDLASVGAHLDSVRDKLVAAAETRRKEDSIRLHGEPEAKLHYPYWP